MEKDKRVFKNAFEKAKKYVKNAAKESGPFVEIKFFPEKKVGDEGKIIKVNKDRIRIDPADRPIVKFAKNVTNEVIQHANTKQTAIGKDTNTEIPVTKGERVASVGLMLGRIAFESSRMPAKPVVRNVIFPQIEKSIMEKIRKPKK